MSEDVKSENAHIHSRADELIACLEGEIAKRDDELAACRVAVENCELFRAELASLKAQEPAFMWHKGATEDESEVVDVDCACPCCVPLYAAPVSEAKAQGVVQWPEADEIMQMAFEEGQPADDASGYCFELEEFDLFIERLMSEVVRLNAAPVQQVGVPASAFASRAITHYEAALLAAFPSGSSGEVFNQWNEARRVLAAAPAAPAADAGHVFYGMDGNHP